MANMDEKEKTPLSVPFDEYDFEKDGEWQVVVKNLEFPVNWNQAKIDQFLQKKKKKYFKSIGGIVEESNPASEHINPPTDDPVPDPEPKPSSTSSRQQQHTSSTKKPSSARSNTKLIPALMNVFYFVGQLLVLLNCVFALVYKPAFRYALYVSILIHLVALFQNQGRPRFAQWYLQYLLQDANAMVVIYSAIFLIGPEIIIFLAPLVLRNYYMANAMLSKLLPVFAPSVYQKLQVRLKNVIRNEVWYLQMIGKSEVVIGIAMILMIFFVRKTVVLTVAYWYVMQVRYLMDPYVQFGFRAVHQWFLPKVSKIPALLNLYLKLTGVLWSIVDPQKIRERMEQGQGAGGLSSALKSCVVM